MKLLSEEKVLISRKKVKKIGRFRAVKILPNLPGFRNFNLDFLAIARPMISPVIMGWIYSNFINLEISKFLKGILMKNPLFSIEISKKKGGLIVATWSQG